jgi:hypothetical protein
VEMSEADWKKQTSTIKKKLEALPKTTVNTQIVICIGMKWCATNKQT